MGLNPFSPNSRVGIREIRDGTSQTLAAGEQRHDMPWVGWTAWGVGAWGFMMSGTRDSLNQSTGGQGDNNAFTSMHEGGAFFLFCDGQVRFLSENIDMGTYRALSTIANNEILDDEDY